MFLHSVVQTALQISTVVALLLVPQVVPMNDGERDVRTWHNPMNPSISLTFSTPETYESCPAKNASDTIVASDISKGWHLKGRLWQSYVLGNTFIGVPDGSYDVDFTSPRANSSFSLKVNYPSVDEWPSDVASANHRALHADLSIEVTDEKGEIVRWIGGDLVNAPGTLGPGGQDWALICIKQGESLYLPQVSKL